MTRKQPTFPDETVSRRVIDGTKDNCFQYNVGCIDLQMQDRVSAKRAAVFYVKWRSLVCYRASPYAVFDSLMHFALWSLLCPNVKCRSVLHSRCDCETSELNNILWWQIAQYTLMARAMREMIWFVWCNHFCMKTTTVVSFRGAISLSNDMWWILDDFWPPRLWTVAIRRQFDDCVLLLSSSSLSIPKSRAASITRWLERDLVRR